MWGPIGYTGYKWPVRSVESLPPFRLQKLRNQVLVIGNTADPITPLVSAKFVVKLLADQAVLVEQLGFGHTTLAELSHCTHKIVADYIMHGIVSHPTLASYSMGSLNHGRLPAPAAERDQVQGRQPGWTIDLPLFLGRREYRSALCGSTPVKQNKPRRLLPTVSATGSQTRCSRTPIFKECNQVETKTTRYNIAYIYRNNPSTSIEGSINVE